MNSKNTKALFLSLSVLVWSAANQRANAQITGVLRDVYTGIPGTSVSDLTNNPSFPDNPTLEEVVTNFFEAPTDVDDNYGQRMTAYILAPQTGTYTFWVASDDNSTLFLSTDSTPANKRVIAYVPGWTSSEEWGKYSEQQSAPISLTAGQKYYIEALMKEGQGGDNLAVGWQLPDSTLEQPVPGNRLQVYGLGPPQITQQPADISVVEGNTAVFSVQLAKSFGAVYQWRRNGGNISGATSSNYSLSPVAMTDSNAQFSCFISNPYGNTNSRAAILTVLPDTTPPSLVRAFNVGTTSVWVVFSEPVEPATATNKSYYALNGITISSAALGPDTKTIVLATAPLTYGATYTVTVNNVRDRAATPNTIAANSQVAFTAAAYAPSDIGGPALTGFIAATTNGFDVTGGGSDIGGGSDQFQFAYQQRTGNFDVKARVESLDPVNTWTKAGLTARATLNPDSTFAGILTTPSIPGTFFESRTVTGGAAGNSGWLPVNHPYTWLRLTRSANTFTGFGSFDGQTWTQLGSASIAMPGTIYFGLIVTSHDPSRLATARFRDIADVSIANVGAVTLPTEPIGPSSRKTGLVISEIMYKPASRTDGRNLEFIELFNSNPFYEDISNYRISGDIDFTFPAGTVLQGGAFLVVAKVPADITAVYGITNVIGPYTNSLPKSGTVRLRNDTDAIFLDIAYSNQNPWPVAADATGHSLVLARPSFGEADPRAWTISDSVGGSPGGIDGYNPSPLRGVVINEFLAHTDPPLYDYIELYNHGNQPVDVSGCTLSDDPTTNRFTISSGTTIPARGFAWFDENQMGFRLSAVGETIYFKNPDGSRVLDAVQFEGQENSVSMGRFPDGASDFYPQQTRTPGTNNSPILVRDIVINEIMYKPISGNDDDQYVELYNKGSGSVDLSGWKFLSGINYTFPSNTTLAASSYLVVAKSATNLMAHYTNLTSLNTLGDFGGKLSGNGERLALAMWDQVVNTNTPGVTKTNIAWIVVDEVTYGTGGRWGQWAHGGGSSLELIDPRSNHRLAYNWADSDETTKAPWTNIETTGVLDNGQNYGGGSIDLVQIGLLGEGECLVDNIECRPGASGANFVSNPDFESGLTGWTLQGAFSRSSLETGQGYSSTHSLHLRGSDSIWTGDNSAQCNLTDTTLASLQTATLRFKARWLRGWPEVLLRVHGNWLETTGKLSVPTNLGTPGAPNSRLVANAGPAIYEVTHTPSIPAANQNVVVTARLHDPNGLQSATLFYRLDPSGTYSSAPMTDNGAGGDAVAGDGIYSATIPGKVAGSVVAFYVQATDTPGASSRFPAALNDNGPVRECVVYFGDTVQATGFGAYHYWLTSANINRWSSLGNLSNEPIDGTWVYGNRVIYNMHGHFAGSPYHQQFDTPNGSYCHYHLDMPEDDQFLGTTSFNKIHAPGNGPFDDDTIQREQTSYWLVRKLGLPWNYRRYVAVYVNGGRRGTLMEDSQVPGGDVLNERFSSDPNGDLYKLQPWFEFDSNGSGFDNVSWCTLNNYSTTGGAKKLARYRWNYLKRAVTDSANNYTNVFALINAANTSGAGYTSAMDALVDTEQWMRTFAVEHAVGNWDAVGCQNEQNMYGYKPTQDKWQLMIWDYNIVLGNSGSWGPGENLFSINGADGQMQAMYNNPPFLRAYWRALEELCNGPMLANDVAPVMDSKYAAFVADGVNVVSPSASVKGWIASARASILAQAASANANAAFAVNGPSSFSTNANQITLTGTAPVAVKTIVVNGVAYPVTWTTLANWRLGIALSGGLNTITIQGFDNKGNVVSGATATLSVNYTGVAEQPQGHLVINEIMYNSALPNASFVELLNTSTTNAFDLSGWRLGGADFTFPGGSIIQPNGFLVVASDLQGFVAAYGSGIPLAGVFSGKLQNGGETLKLVKPGATPAQDVTIDEVTYDSAAPWPTVANGFGPSLQLIDPTQDNNRVANWAASITNASLGPQWQFVTVTGTATSSRLYIYLSAPPGGGDAYIDDIKLVDGGTPEVGTNYINNGAFETALSGPWNLTANTAGSAITASFAHSGTSSLHLVCGTNGTTVTDSIWQDLGPLTNGNQYTLSYWYLPNTNGPTLTIRLSGSGVRSDQNIAPSAFQSTALYTPGAPNSVRTNLTTFPLVWLNEIQPNNVSGVQDRFGHHHPWVELYNGGASALNLAGYYLANNYSNLTQWPFPATATINPGQFMVVYVDGNGSESVSNELHTSFAAPQLSGSIALTRAVGNQTTLVDYLNYNLVNADRSYGAFPDGTPARRQKFYYATPGATNDSTWPAVPVTINEWMASNTGTFADPADGHYDDWFELYNAGPTGVDLSGYTLTDTPTNSTQFVIPSGYVVPAGGYLLVWADNDTSQNTTNSPELHTNFKLSGSGEFIGLYSPNGTNIDGVSFGAQTNDISQGRYPDGNSGQYYFMLTPTPGTANLLGAVSNHPPVLAPIGAQSINEGSQLIFTAMATDPDTGQTFVYSLDPGAPQGASINPSSGVFIWTPSEAQGPGSYSITVRVTDNGSPALSDFETITITVNEVNSAPSLAFINNQSVNEGSLLTFVVSASDPDAPANALTFSLDPGAPAGASINPTNGTFTWTPTEAQGPGTNSITVRVTDNGVPPLSDAQTFSVTVNEVNVAPALAPIGPQTVNEGSNLAFIAPATDSDVPANTLLFSLDPGAPAGASINPTTGAFTWTPTEAQGPGTNSITVRVTDNGSPALSDSKTFTVVVNEVNVAPVLAAIANQSATAGILLSITNSATDADMPANTLRFTLDPGAPVGATITTNGLFSWMPSTNQAPSTNSITVRVTDDGSPPLSDAKIFTVVVNATTELRLTAITAAANNLVTLNWSSQAGLIYRVEYKDDLGQTNWNSLGDYNATGASTSATNTISGTLQRFYRIHQL